MKKVVMFVLLVFVLMLTGCGKEVEEQSSTIEWDGMETILVEEIEVEEIEVEEIITETIFTETIE